MALDKFGQVARDANNYPVENLSVKNFRASMVAVTASGWSYLGDLLPRNHLLVVSPDTNTAKVILAPNNTTASNDLTNAACGIPLSPDRSLPFDFTENIPVYARVVAAGAACKIYIAESL